MSGIKPVNSAQSNQYNIRRNIIKYSGYGALVSGITSGVMAKSHNIKPHKTFAYFSGILAIIHLIAIKYSPTWFNKKF